VVLSERRGFDRVRSRDGISSGVLVVGDFVLGLDSRSGDEGDDICKACGDGDGGGMAAAEFGVRSPARRTLGISKAGAWMAPLLPG